MFESGKYVQLAASAYAFLLVQRGRSIIFFHGVLNRLVSIAIEYTTSTASELERDQRDIYASSHTIGGLGKVSPLPGRDGGGAT